MAFKEKLLKVICIGSYGFITYTRHCFVLLNHGTLVINLIKLFDSRSETVYHSLINNAIKTSRQVASRIACICISEWVIKCDIVNHFYSCTKQHKNSAIPPISCHINAGILNGPICFAMCLKCWCKVNFLKIYIENKAFWWNRKYNTDLHTSLYNLFQVLLSFNFALNVIYFTTITKQVIQLL